MTNLMYFMVFYIAFLCILNFLIVMIKSIKIIAICNGTITIKADEKILYILSMINGCIVFKTKNYNNTQYSEKSKHIIPLKLSFILE